MDQRSPPPDYPSGSVVKTVPKNRRVKDFLEWLCNYYYRNGDQLFSRRGRRMVEKIERGQQLTVLMEEETQ